MMTRHASILFVCTGNICRSPTAEGILRHRLSERGLLESFTIDSAATHSWNIGNPPDSRTAAVAKENGVSLEGLKARKIRPADFQDFSLILAMDKTHLGALRAHAPDQTAADIRLFLEGREVPDPYYGEMEGFRRVYEMIDRGVDALIREVLMPRSGAIGS